MTYFVLYETRNLNLVDQSNLELHSVQRVRVTVCAVIIATLKSAGAMNDIVKLATG